MPDPFTRRIPHKLNKTLTFDGGAGSGAVGTVAVFTVIGSVLLEFLALRCETLLAGASATIELGTENNTAALVAQTTATDLDADEYWQDATPEAEVSDAIVNKVVNSDVILTVGTADVTAGVIAVECYWRPLSGDGKLA